MKKLIIIQFLIGFALFVNPVFAAEDCTTTDYTVTTSTGETVHINFTVCIEVEEALDPAP